MGKKSEFVNHLIRLLAMYLFMNLDEHFDFLGHQIDEKYFYLQ